MTTTIPDQPQTQAPTKGLTEAEYVQLTDKLLPIIGSLTARDITEVLARVIFRVGYVNGYTQGASDTITDLTSAAISHANSKEIN